MPGRVRVGDREKGTLESFRSQITVPTLVVGSRHDGDTGYVNSTHAAGAIPNVEFITADQFGHLISWGDRP